VRKIENDKFDFLSKTTYYLIFTLRRFIFNIE